MIINAKDYSGPDYRPMTATGAVRSVVEKMQIGESLVIEDFIDAVGASRGAKYVRAYIVQTAKPNEKFVTRAVGDKLHIWRVA